MVETSFGIDLKNNSSQGINLLTPKHDKWY